MGTTNPNNAYYRRFDYNGNPLSGDLKVSPSDATQGVPSIAMRSDGYFVIAFHDSGEEDDSGVYALRFDNNGNQIGDKFLVNSYTEALQAYPCVAMND